MYFGNMLTTEQEEEWKKKNSHNETVLEYCRNIQLEKIVVGKKSYGALNVIGFGQKDESLSIGCFCSIAREVVFLLGGEHDYYRLSTYPFRNKIFGETEAISKGPIIVGDDVWIGYRATILSGVTIGQGAIIAAGSVIARDIPPYAIADSNRIIKYRFKETTIQKLLKFDFSSLEETDFYKYEDLFTTHNLEKTFFESEFYLSHLKRSNYAKIQSKYHHPSK